MRTRDKAEIGTDFPDDMVEEDGEIVQWGGKGVAAAIAEILRRLWAEVSEPINADEHGWELDIRYKAATRGARSRILATSSISTWMTGGAATIRNTSS